MSFFRFVLPFIIGYVVAFLCQGFVFKLMTLGWIVGQLIGFGILIGVAWLIWKWFR
jgi:hypothetical protein